MNLLSHALFCRARAVGLMLGAALLLPAAAFGAGNGDAARFSITLGDTTPPTTTAGPAVSAGPTANTVSVSVTVNESGTGYWLVQLATSTVPTAASLSSAGTAVAMSAGIATVVNATGLTPNTAYKFYFVATDALNNVQPSVGSVAFFTSAESIPALPVTINGVTSLPAITDLASGAGPAFAADMVTLLSSVVGATLSYGEQNAQGTVTLAGYNNGKLAFIPHSFLASDPRPNGVYPVGNGQYQVVRNGQSLVIAPALVRLDQLTALYPGVRASVGVNGVLAVSLNGTNYLVQPGVAVELGTSRSTASLVTGADGVLRFTDTAGNTQALYPAIAEPSTLRSVVQGLDVGATLQVQLDGTASLGFKGNRFTLAPDLTLAPVPPARAGQRWWQDSQTRYWLANLQTLGTAQGLTLR